MLSASCRARTMLPTRSSTRKRALVGDLGWQPVQADVGGETRRASLVTPSNVSPPRLLHFGGSGGVGQESVRGRDGRRSISVRDEFDAVCRYDGAAPAICVVSPDCSRTEPRAGTRPLVGRFNLARPPRGAIRQPLAAAQRNRPAISVSRGQSGHLPRSCCPRPGKTSSPASQRSSTRSTFKAFHIAWFNSWTLVDNRGDAAP